MRVAIYTLGCKMNQYETQAMEQLLRRKGHQVVDFSQEADAYVVNTCSVTAVSDQKSRKVLHRVRRERPGAVLAVCGCYPQTHVEDVRKLDVDLIAGTGDRAGFVDLLEQAVEELIIRETGKAPNFVSGSTDCNVSFANGIPSVCFGGCTGYGAHTREEWLEIVSLTTGMRCVGSVLLKDFE